MMLKLTNREREVITLVAKGLSDKQIANELQISRRTVQTHISRIFVKLGVNNRVGAVTFFLDARVIA